MSTLDDWIHEVTAELGIEELGELVDPAYVRPLVLDLTRDVAHGVARPAAPITAYLLGLAVARAAGSGPAETDVASAHAEHLAALARTRSGDGGGTPDPGPGGADLADDIVREGPEPDAEAGTAADPAVGSN